MAASYAFNRLLQVSINVGVIQNGFGVYANVVVDDELQPRQADARIRHLSEVESELRVADVHHDLHGRVRQLAAHDVGDLGFEQAVVDVARVLRRLRDRRWGCRYRPWCLSRRNRVATTVISALRQQLARFALILLFD